MDIRRVTLAAALVAACSGSPSSQLSDGLGARDGGPAAPDAALGEDSDSALEADGSAEDAAVPTSDLDAGEPEGTDASAPDEEPLDGALATADAEPADAQPALDAQPDAAPLDAELDAGAIDAGAVDAAAQLVDFESVTDAAMGNSSGVVPPASSRLAAIDLPTARIRFSSGADYVAVVQLGLGHATSGTRGIGGVNANGALDYASPFEVRFYTPSGTPAITDFVRIRGDTRPASGTATMTAYGLDDQQLDQVSVGDTSGLTLQLRRAGIHYVRIAESLPNIAFDDLSYGAVSAP